ncbi:NUDIX domain-containing protein [Actinomadura gamaensis]|uniref:NUDIX domain-containing protein n=1 Tax=Actinomadura gamaensis TaxID=1763541 RepID=A0ABV9U6W5_9ACTN
MTQADPRPVGDDPASVREVVVRRSARVLAVNDGRLALLRRTRPGMPVYYVTPGGKVEEDDADVVAALHREVREELGGVITDPVQVFLLTERIDDGPVDGVRRLRVQHIFAAELVSYDLSARSGPEFTEPEMAVKGTYDLEWVPLVPERLGAIHLRAPELAEYVIRNCAALAAEARRSATGRH